MGTSSEGELYELKIEKNQAVYRYNQVNDNIDRLNNVISYMYDYSELLNSSVGIFFDDYTLYKKQWKGIKADEYMDFIQEQMYHVTFSNYMLKFKEMQDELDKRLSELNDQSDSLNERIKKLKKKIKNYDD